MAVISCPQCSARVQLTSDRFCPACRTQIDESGKPVLVPVEEPVVPTAVPPKPVRGDSVVAKEPLVQEPLVRNQATVVHDAELTRSLARRSWIVPLAVLALNAILASVIPYQYRHMGALVRMGLFAVGLLAGFVMAITALTRSRGEKGVVIHGAIGLFLNLTLAAALLVTFVGISSLRRQSLESEVPATRSIRISRLHVL